MIPTPETHRYIGMWRPPLETVIARLVAENEYLQCNCDALISRWDYASPEKGRREILTHWLAGHFDEPQYETKETAHAG